MIPDVIAKAIDTQARVNNLFGSPSMAQALRNLPQDRQSCEARLFEEMLFPILQLDDSISNSLLGNIFDPWSDSPVSDSFREFARLYGSKFAFVSCNGTTSLNVAAGMSLASENKPLIVGRDAHVSVIAALVLSGAKPVFVQPEYDSDSGVLLPVSPRRIETALRANTDVKGVIVTLPTYHGLQGDIGKIVSICRSRKVPIMCDEAHGPHYRWLRNLGFPQSAESAGADIITQSVHKVLPGALSQGSLALFNDERLYRGFCRASSLGFQSTSFSFVIYMSVESAIERIRNKGKTEWMGVVHIADHFRRRAARLPGVRIPDEKLSDRSLVFGIDPARVTLNVRSTGLTGFEIAEKLEQAGHIPEMASPDVLLFLISPSKTHAQIDAVLDSLERILEESPPGAVPPPFEPPPLPEQIMTPKEAMTAKRIKRVPVEQAEGQICAETIGCYPPGTAILVAGERVSKEALDYLKGATAAGAHLKRVFDDHFQTIEIVDE